MRIFHFSTRALSVALTVACADARATAAQRPTVGLYRQATYPDTEQFPLRTIRIESNDRYELDATVARSRGAFRVRRDSVFFDDRAGGGDRVALAGTFTDDALLLRIVGAEAFAQDSSELRPVRFVRVRGR